MVRFSDLLRLYGDAGAREQFEKLCGQLICSQYPTARGVRCDGGDGGVDFFVGDQADPSGICVFQVKYFLGGLKDAQKRQIRESFRQCRENPAFSLKEWILCVPFDLSQNEITWFARWSAEEASTLLPPTRMDWWGETKLSNLLLLSENSGVKEQFFPEKHARQLAAMQETLAHLVEGLSALMSGTKNYQTHWEQHTVSDRPRVQSEQERNAQRKQICLPLLTSLHEFVPLVATFRQLHDDLWARQRFFWLPAVRRRFRHRLDAFFTTTIPKAAATGSALSIDPDGQGALAAFVAYLKAQETYIQAITAPMRIFPNYFFVKADTQMLDGLAKQADEQFIALEDALRFYVNTPQDSEQPLVLKPGQANQVD